MKLKDEFKKTQGKKWLVPWSDQKEIKYQAAYIRFLESKIEQLTMPTVVGKSEQFYCASDKDNRYEKCEKQCHLCKMDY